MTQAVASLPVALLAAVLTAIIGGTIGAALGLWLEHWMHPPPRRRPIGAYDCPHGFASVRDCPTCAHFGKIREQEQELGR